jgi:predicted dehydrogenase
MTGSPPLRAAVVGAGLMGRWHADAVRRAGFTVGAVVDADRQRADTLAARYRARAATTLGGVLDAVDVVHVCTPTATHEMLAAEAIAAGRHALVEKPLAVTAAQTRALLAQASARGVLVCPVHQFPWQPGARRLADTLPALGTVRHVDFTACSAGAIAAGSADPDTIALEILPHPLSLLAHLLPAALAAPWTACRPAPGEWRLTADAAGATVSIVVSMAGRPTVNALRVVAAGGTAHLDLFHGFAVVEDAAVSRGRKIGHPFALAAATGAAAATNLARRAASREPAYPGLRALVTRFYRAVADGTAPPVSAAEAIAIAEIVDRARAALTAGARPASAGA